jgi:hypothetical protein
MIDTQHGEHTFSKSTSTRSRQTQHVLGLEVSVGDLVAVQLSQRQHHGGRVEAGLLLGQLARGLQEVEELPAWQQLQHKVPAQRNVIQIRS